MLTNLSGGFRLVSGMAFERLTCTVLREVDGQTPRETTGTVFSLHQKHRSVVYCRFDDLLTGFQPSQIVHTFAQNQIFEPPQNSTPPLTAQRVRAA